MSAEPSSEVQNLEHHECWAMLRTVSVGRLAITAGGRPDIFPINYTVDRGTLVFRTSEGTKLSGASEDAAVAVEADGVDPDTGLAWSVVVKGTAAVVTGTEQVLDTTQLYLFPWQAGRKDVFVRITPDSVTGRRFKVTEPLTWWTQLSGAVTTSQE
ncbi:pyridoxamine 5'-phosphate oxidase family protein [Pseudarthrobacter phenanthrenivorans]|uniref:Pyridoxamine 5'-phosphate oxidase family protein n=1 Tax=Pseudarthrobacter phenanthrenivorans TaxID=361575 RepID=A0A3B0G5U6_PSEPS|nr:pyridoxamine 5'-phosphate oxidase family protein [Pseudarthrobacter phenanthrenivorans]RKO27418.1 pyridoxamine 5'-phosphate oxidase family protein [Pseudarthrobacter phenanthrenivorans]TPV53359.1 pyridoxamine 5'-phosphate oxidase family protein [Pseudarthrobacter phenanthrenivorans]